MRSRKEFALVLVSIELNLNKICEERVPLGSILAKYHENIYRNTLKKHSLLKYFLIWMRSIIIGIFIKDPKIHPSKTLLINKLVNKRHCNDLMDPIKSEFKNKAAVFEPSVENQIKPYNFTRKINIRIFIETIVLILKYIQKIFDIYKENKIKISKVEYLFTIYIQLLAFKNWINFFEKSEINLVIVDFDRSDKTAPMIAAANKKNIHTVTLVHGVINLPYGYYPVIAKEIWCWGNFQKKQLVSLGLENERIKIVGSPIAKKIKLDKIVRNNFHPVIGVALNPMGDYLNKKFIDYLISDLQINKCQLVIKLHPSMKKKRWMDEVKSDNVSFYSDEEMKIDYFFSRISMMVVGNSGIGYEALINDIPIWVYRISGRKYGHDHVMVEQGRCPDITSKLQLEKEVQFLLNDKNYLNELLKLEQQFVFNDYFAAIGKIATQNIIHLIKQKMK